MQLRPPGGLGVGGVEVLAVERQAARAVPPEENWLLE